MQAQGASVRENEQGVPFLFYNWNKYVHRNNPEQVISRDDYMKLYEEEQKLYKGVHNREIRTLFNIDQTTLPTWIRSDTKRRCGGMEVQWKEDIRKLTTDGCIFNSTTSY